MAFDGVKSYSRDGDFTLDAGIMNLLPTKGRHRVANHSKNYFDSYGCHPPDNLPKFIIKQTGHCLYSQYKFQSLVHKRAPYCASFCLYVIHLTDVLEKTLDLLF